MFLIFFMKIEIPAHFTTMAISLHSFKCHPRYTCFFPCNCRFCLYIRRICWLRYVFIIYQITSKRARKMLQSYYSNKAWSSFSLREDQIKPPFLWWSLGRTIQKATNLNLMYTSLDILLLSLLTNSIFLMINSCHSGWSIIKKKH